MAEVVTIELSKLPPSANALWRSAPGGTVYKSPRYTAWIKTAKEEMLTQRRGTVKGPYALQLRFRAPDARSRDLDNLIKPTSDVLAEMNIVENDALAVRIEAEWVSEGPAVWARVIATMEAA